MKTLIYLVKESKESEADAPTAEHAHLEVVPTPTDEAQDTPEETELTDDDKKLLKAVGKVNGITYADLAKALEKPAATGQDKLRFCGWVQSLCDRGLLKTKTIEITSAAA